MLERLLRVPSELPEAAPAHNNTLPSSIKHPPRPELLRLPKEARKGDVLLVESIGRLPRLLAGEWQRLKTATDSKGLRIVALDLPTSHQ